MNGTGRRVPYLGRNSCGLVVSAENGLGAGRLKRLLVKSRRQRSEDVWLDDGSKTRKELTSFALNNLKQVLFPC